MSLLKHDKFWDALIRLYTTKKMLQLSLKKCDLCHKTVLEKALDSYGGINRPKCKKNNNIYSQIIVFWIEFLRKSLNIERKKVEKLLADPYAQRAVINIAKSFKHYGIKKPLCLYAPFLIVWDFTHKCNLKCQHCYSNSGIIQQEEVSTKQAMDIVDQVADAGVTALAFSGGEPLSRSDFFEVANHATKRGLYVSVATNGTLLSKSMVKKLKKSKINYVEISIDGATAESHDSFRGVPGAFDRAIQGLKNCIEANLCTCIATTATKKNIDEIPAIIDLAEEVGAERFTYFNFIPTGRGKEHFNQDLSSQEREKLMRYLLYRMSKGCKTTILTTAPQLARVALQCQESKEAKVTLSMAHMQTVKVSKKAVPLADFIGGCGAGRLYCSISPQGHVHPCVFFPVKVGDLKTQNFTDIWLNSDMFKALRDRSKLKGTCRECNFKYICGGCRARANAYYGDYLSSDVGCILAKKEVPRAK